MINAYAALKAKERLQSFSYEEEIGPYDVVVAISHCGICHSDVHLADGDWGDVFPCVPGHEIIGKVEKVGEQVSSVSIGDTVGVGWQCDSCNQCTYCEKDEETFCEKRVATCMGHFGGFAKHVVTNERFAIPIPKEMDLSRTAPLLCGGITVYTPLKEYAKRGDSVAIIGIGGLGHLGIQLAKALGCKVTAISTSPEKEEEAKLFGADEFITSDPKPRSFDVILNTAHFSPDMDLYLASLKPEGTFVQLGASPEALKMGAFGLIDENKRVVGSSIGTPNDIKEMIQLAHENKIYAQVEEMNMEDVDEAMEKTRTNKARYRIVLKN